MSEVANKYFLTGRTEMMMELQAGRHNHRILGIWANSVCHSMILCRVKEIVNDADEDDVLVVLDEIYSAEHRPTTHVLYLSEIDRIYNFNTQPNATLRAHKTET